MSSWHTGTYPTVTSLGDSDIFLGAQSGASVVFTGSTLKNYVKSGSFPVSDSTQAATPGNTTLTALYTFTLPAATLNTDGWFIRFRAWGTTGMNNNNKRLQITLGGTGDLSGYAALNNFRWHVDVIFMRTAAGNQDVSLMYDTSATTTWGDTGGATQKHIVLEEWAEDLNSDLDIVISGQSQQNIVVAASDIVYERSIITLNG